ncbi:hypothetical protein FJNA_11270 [Thermus sp. FJN-A]
MVWVLGGWAWALDLPPLPLPPLPPIAPPIETPKPPPSPKPGSQEAPQRFYGQVTLAAGQVPLVAGVPLRGNSPWLPLLAPGMLVEAEGTWQGGGFVAEALRVVFPTRFAYYRGPGLAVGQRAYPGVEVWTVEEGGGVRVFALRVAPEGGEVRLVAYWDGQRLQALPAGLSPPSLSLPPGWVEVLGVYREGRVRWVQSRPFP